MSIQDGAENDSDKHIEYSTDNDVADRKRLGRQ